MRLKICSDTAFRFSSKSLCVLFSIADNSLAKQSRYGLLSTFSFPSKAPIVIKHLKNNSTRLCPVNASSNISSNTNSRMNTLNLLPSSIPAAHIVQRDSSLHPSRSNFSSDPNSPNFPMAYVDPVFSTRQSSRARREIHKHIYSQLTVYLHLNVAPLIKRMYRDLILASFGSFARTSFSAPFFIMVFIRSLSVLRHLFLWLLILWLLID